MVNSTLICSRAKRFLIILGSDVLFSLTFLKTGIPPFHVTYDELSLDLTMNIDNSSYKIFIMYSAGNYTWERGGKHVRG